MRNLIRFDGLCGVNRKSRGSLSFVSQDPEAKIQQKVSSVSEQRILVTGKTSKKGYSQLSISGISN